MRMDVHMDAMDLVKNGVISHVHKNALLHVTSTVSNRVQVVVSPSYPVDLIMSQIWI